MTAHHNPLVLVVDDDVVVRTEIAEILSDRGYEVREASNGKQALDALRGGPRPCVILLDLRTPEMSGEEFRTAQRRDSALEKIPIVLVSGADRLDRAAEDLEASGFLQKPFGIEDLIQEVGRHCRPAVH